MTKSNVSTFDQFYSETRKRVLSFAYRLTKCKDDAEDLVQESYIRALKAFDRRDENRSPFAWMFQIVYRCFIDRYRMTKCRPHCVSFQSITDDNPARQFADPSSTPEETLMGITLDEDLSQIVAGLDEKHRTVLRQAIDDEMTLEQIGELQGCSKISASRRVKKAKLTLARQIQQGQRLAGAH